MSRVSLEDFRYTKLSISRSFTDAMWQWSMDVPFDYPIPSTWEPVEEIWGGNCILLGFPLTKTPHRSKSSRGVTASGFSYGWYTANRPIRPENRLLSSYVSGSTIIVEDPIGYLSRLIHGPNGTEHPCGLVKGGWDTSISGWGSSLPYQQFESTDKSTVQNVIDDVCEYTGNIHYDDWIKQNGVWVPCDYFRADIDTGCNLPAPLTISSSGLDVRTNQVMVNHESEVNGEKWYNSVWVDGVIQGSLSGISARRPASWNTTTMGLERAYQYCYTLPSSVSMDQAKALIAQKCNDLYSLLSMPAETFEVRFFNRTDIKLMQKITFTGFSDIPEDPMRVIKISYDIDKKNGLVCTCSCAADRPWSAARKLAVILNQDYLLISDTVQRAVERQKSTVVYGTLVSTSTSSSGVLQKGGTGAFAYTSLPNQ